MDRFAVVLEARTWIGTPWKHQGRLKGVAVDCIGLVGGVAIALGLSGAAEWAANPNFHNYGRQPDPELLCKGCELLLDPIDVAEPGDVLVMRFVREPQHFALMSGYAHVIHAYAQARKVVENRLDEKWQSRIVSAWRFRGID